MDRLEFYRAKNWPMDPASLNPALNFFGKRVKGTEAILALQSKGLSKDEQSRYYWLGPTMKGMAA
jgi:hypothetical protein